MFGSYSRTLDFRFFSFSSVQWYLDGISVYRWATLCFTPVSLYIVLHPCQSRQCASPLSVSTMCFTPVSLYTVLHPCQSLHCASPLSVSTLCFTPVSLDNVLHPCQSLHCASPLSVSTLCFTPVSLYNVRSCAAIARGNWVCGVFQRRARRCRC